MTAGFAPSEFWGHTPRSYVTTMEAAARAAKRRHDEAASLAWHTAVFNSHAKAGKLKKLSHYLGAGQPRKAQSPSEMLALLKGFEKHGMKITRLN